MDILSRFTDLSSSSPFLSENTVRVWYVVVSSDQVFLSENLYGRKACGRNNKQSNDDKLK